MAHHTVSSGQMKFNQHSIKKKLNPVTSNNIINYRVLITTNINTTACLRRYIKY